MKWRDPRFVPDAILIDPALRIPPRIERVGNKVNGGNSDPGTNQSIHARSQPVDVQSLGSMKIGDLSQCMYAGVGPAGGLQPYRLAEDLPQRSLDRPLDRWSVGLELPAMEEGSIVFEDKPVIQFLDEKASKRALAGC